MQRHSVRFIVSRICASVGFGVRDSSAVAAMIWPFWQNPHCGTCSSIQACWTGLSAPRLASPSSVVTSPFTPDVGVTQERVAVPLMITAHAPHCPRPQPKRGPCRFRSLRRTYSRGVDGSTSTVWFVPFTFNVILAMSVTIDRLRPEIKADLMYGFVHVARQICRAGRGELRVRSRLVRIAGRW